MPVSLPPGALTPRPRRVVDKRGGQTTVTRKSAPARITALQQATPILTELAPANPIDNVILSPKEPLRRRSVYKPLTRHGTIDFENSLSSDDGSDSDSSYNNFILSLKKMDALALDSQLRVNEMLDRTYSDRGIGPSPTLPASSHSRATTSQPEYFEEGLEYVDYQGPRSKRIKKEVIKWIVVPYFYLTSQATSLEEIERETNLFALGTKDSLSKGDFFQVTQFWCLIIGDNLVISSCRVTLTQIPKALINFTQVLPSLNSTPDLQVSDGGLKVWFLPVEECKTWFSFISHFVSLGFATFEGWQVKYRNVVLTPSDWNTVISAAKKCTVKLEMVRKYAVRGLTLLMKSAHNPRNDAQHDDDLFLIVAQKEPESTLTAQTGQSLQPALSPVPSPLSEFSSESEPALLSFDGPKTKSELHVDDFHVFTLLVTVTIPQGKISTSETRYRIDEKQLVHDLSELGRYLSSTNTRPMETITYSECPTKTFSEVLHPCSTLESDHGGHKKTLARAVREIFQLFFPLHYEHAVTLKFWGSIDRIVQNRSVKLEPIISDIVQLSRLTREIREELFSDKEASGYTTTVPHEFIQAWMRLQVYFAGFLSDNSQRSANRLHRCKDRLLQGRLKMVERLRSTSIRDREAVLPLGAILLLLGQLLHDSQGPVTPERHRLASTYWTAFRKLKVDVYENPLKRTYERVFIVLKDEFETIIGTLEDQQRVLIAIEDSIAEVESESLISPSPKNVSVKPSREASVTEYLMHQTEEMLQNFREMSRHLADLENYHFLCLSMDNDMQQKASFTFTTVTVFFLPLTTLAGVLGMNTSDVRDMEQTQWLFWSIAIPLAVFSLSTWFIYLGTLKKAWRWGRKRRTLKKTKAA